MRCPKVLVEAEVEVVVLEFRRLHRRRRRHRRWTDLLASISSALPADLYHHLRPLHGKSCSR